MFGHSPTIIRPAASWMFFLVLGISVCPGTAQAENIKHKAAVDFVYLYNGYILRFRPVDYVNPPGSTRFDALIGKNFGWFNAYLYWKINNAGQNYLGLRADSTFEIRKRWRASIQARGFLGMNQNSPDHIYFITHLNYRLDKKGRLRLGIMEYGIKELGGSTVIYVGPALTIRPSQLLSFRLSYGDDFLNSSRLWYGKITVYL